MLRAVENHVPRPRLLGGHVLPPVLLIEGPAGSGKSVLVHEFAARRGTPVAVATLVAGTAEPYALVDRLRRGLTAAGYTDAATCLTPRDATPVDAARTLNAHLEARDDAVVVAIDGAHHLDADGAELLVELASGFPDGHHLLVLAHRVDAALARLRLLTPTLVDGDDLEFTVDEATALFNDAMDLDLSPRQVRAVHATTAGRALGLVVAGRRLGAAEGLDAFEDELAGLISRGDAVGHAVDAVLGQLSRRDRRALVQLAALPWCDDDLAVTAVRRADALDAAVRAQLAAPDVRHRVRFPEPVRTALAERGGPNPRVVRRAAAVYAERDELATAVRLLVGAALDADAADILEQASARSLRTLSVTELAAVIDDLPEDVVDARPRLLLVLARAWHETGRPDAQHAALDRADQLGQRLDERLARAVEAERLRDVALRAEGRCEPEQRRCEQLLDALHPTESDLRARLHEGLGLIEIRQADTGWHDRALEHLTAAIDAYTAAGEPWLAAMVATMAATRVSLPAEEHDDAASALDRAVALAEEIPTLIALVLAFRARVNVLRGRHPRARADLAEALRLARLLGDTSTEELTSRIGSELHRAVRGAAPPRAADGAAPTDVEVHALDGLVLRVDGEEVDLPRGLATQLVKVLAVRGGRLHEEEVARALWPDEDPGEVAGRIDRVRQRVGNHPPVVLRDGEFLAFASGSRIDISTFLELAREASTGDSEDPFEPIAARAAIGRYGELLPGEDEDWVSIARERLRSTALGLLDRLLDHALATGQVDDALRWAEQAWRTDPIDADRQQRMTALLLEHGRTARARDLGP